LRHWKKLAACDSGAQMKLIDAEKVCQKSRGTIPFTLDSERVEFFGEAIKIKHYIYEHDIKYDIVVGLTVHRKKGCRMKRSSLQTLTLA
jgi:hypothetical protein